MTKLKSKMIKSGIGFYEIQINGECVQRIYFNREHFKGKIYSECWLIDENNKRTEKMGFCYYKDLKKWVENESIEYLGLNK